MIYNLAPRRIHLKSPICPWQMAVHRSQKECESADHVLKFDEVDIAAAREMAKALGWEEGPGAINLGKDLFCWYTLVRKPR